MIIDNYSYETIRHDTFAFHEKCNPENNDSIIKVIGVGGGGGNAVNYMYKKGIDDVTFMLCDTDNQALNDSPVPVHLQLGQEGLGASNKPEKARLAAEESIYDVCSMLDDGTKIAFIIAGMGGGTGSGAAPVIAQKSKELGILTVGIVTIPFRFEGSKKIDLALDGVREMSKHMDALLVINNERLRENNPNLSISNSFAKADETLGIAAESMIETIMTNGLMNLDFNNIKTILKDCEVTTLKHNAIAFYEKYKDYISVSKLKDSVLWRNIVNQRAKQLKEELII
ncbi:MAG: cell division FtsZ family protein [Prevotella sp.]|nr:cell division FtsZ family protein [Prevotella sp.]